jgi:G3E family GTPase
MVVNDVAKVNIDSKLVRERTTGGLDVGDCVELQNGCACCNARCGKYCSRLDLLTHFGHLHFT